MPCGYRFNNLLLWAAVVPSSLCGFASLSVGLLLPLCPCGVFGGVGVLCWARSPTFSFFAFTWPFLPVRFVTLAARCRLGGLRALVGSWLLAIVTWPFLGFHVEGCGCLSATVVFRCLVLLRPPSHSCMSTWSVVVVGPGLARALGRAVECGVPFGLVTPSSVRLIRGWIAEHCCLGPLGWCCCCSQPDFGWSFLSVFPPVLQSSRDEIGGHVRTALRFPRMMRLKTADCFFLNRWQIYVLDARVELFCVFCFL